MLVDPKWMRFYARMSSAVLAKVVLIAIGYFVGSSLDAKYQTYPILLFVCVTVALGIGIFGIVYLAEKEMNKVSADEGQGEYEGPTPKTPRELVDDDDDGDAGSDEDDDEPPRPKKKKSNPKIYT